MHNSEIFINMGGFRKCMKEHGKFFFIVLFIVSLDQLVKFVIRASLTSESSILLVKNFFSITYLQNTGISFGLLKGNNALFAAIAAAALFIFFHFYNKEKKYWLQYALITGGIIGNLIDRLYLGYVVDYFNFHFFPVFNIADSSIFIGIAWLIILSFRDAKKYKGKKKRK